MSILLIILDDFAFLAGEATRFIDYGTIDFFIRDLDVVAITDLGQQQAEPHPALGNDLVFCLQVIDALA